LACNAFQRTAVPAIAGAKKMEADLGNAAAEKIEVMQSGSELGIKCTDSLSEHAVLAGRNVVHRQPIDHAMVPPRKAEADSTQRRPACSACLVHELNLCAGVRKKAAEINWRPGAAPLESTVHTIPARRTICHPKEWSEYVPIICQGWAISSITLPDGRRQILSFLLSGDLVSTACLLEPMLGLTVEAVTEVTYRKFKRSEIRPFLFGHSDLLEILSKTWIEERMQGDQLALDLGRRTADERIARLILNLAPRLAKRDMVNGSTMDFPLRQRHIADATGLTPVHVSKVLGEFQRSGLIEISSRSLKIINETELRRVADWR
jgi:CRP/FNR family transcriptional regulator